MESLKPRKKEKIENRGFLNLVFSWSVDDVLNKDLYKDKVAKIPETFGSIKSYLKSFIHPLIEETHCDLSSNLKSVSKTTPTSEILSFKKTKDFKLPNDLFYTIKVKGKKKSKENSEKDLWVGDLIALTEVQPKCIDDLIRPNRPFLLAYVYRAQKDNPNTFIILTSKPITMSKDGLETSRNFLPRQGNSETDDQKKGILFGVYLINMTTNFRIWKALNPDPKGTNLNIIKNVCQPMSSGCTSESHCTALSSEENNSPGISKMLSTIGSFDLNDSQESAILSCIRKRECHHANTVKLIWGPPGTGKTKTVGVLLFVLLKLKCRTLTCAPTNTAVLEVTTRLMRLVSDTFENDTYGLGDIVLFGNGERLKIEECDGLADLFLDYRIDMLSRCFAPMYGWGASLVAMIDLLRDPEEQYKTYLKSWKTTDISEEDDDEVEEQKPGLIHENEEMDKNQRRKQNRKMWKQAISKSLKGNKDRKTKSSDKKNSENKLSEDPLSFEEFIGKKFKCYSERLKFCIVNLYTHLPTSILSRDVVENMKKASDRLKDIEKVLSRRSKKQLFKNVDTRITFLTVPFRCCLKVLKLLPNKFSVPDFIEKYMIKNFCLANATLVFCTASSSAKLQTAGMAPFEMLIIDEAAQLKECESAIPLQLPGLRHAILIGDERQLPAMVQSSISEKAEFGRSLFQRLVLLRYEKHLLNIQYRMHPSISFFPNKEFYKGQIQDAPVVKGINYKKQFLDGNMYSSYSFINIARGKEQFDAGHSQKNMVEAAVATQIVESLFKEFLKNKVKISVGIVSPYKAQVYEIKDKIGNKYASNEKNGFTVNVRSVDGFQGGEEDVIIISTVRCNGVGSVGFLSNNQRANVALTRARFCMWILGNEATLLNSGSVWRELIIDARLRGCLHNADEDKSLSVAITAAMGKINQIDVILNMNSLNLKKARWKVLFSKDFWKSVARIKDPDTLNELRSLLKKLSNGWRQSEDERNIVLLDGKSSELLEQYPINGNLTLLWAVEIQKETSYEIQVLKFWEVLPSSDIPKHAKSLDKKFVNYTVNKINRCKFQSTEGNYVVPKKWPVDVAGSSNNSRDDLLRNLSRSFGSLSLMEQDLIKKINLQRNFQAQFQGE